MKLLQFFHKKDVTYSSTDIKGWYQSFVASPNFYLSSLSAKQLCVECHPDPQPPREAMLPSHPTPTWVTPASCSLGLVMVVSVSGALWCGWEEVWGLGQQCGMLFLWRGMGWRLSSSGLPLKHSKKDKAALRQQCLLFRPVYVQTTG